MAMEDLKGMLQQMLKEKEAKKAQAEQERQAKNDGDRNKILENISGDLSKSLAPVLENLAKNSKLSTDDIRQALAEAIQINLPEIKMPDIPAPVVNVPAPIVHIPPANIPAPKVTVQPTPVNFPDAIRLKPNDKPFPVRMVDVNGKDVQFPVSMGGGGTNFPREVLDTTGTNPALRVSGSFSVTSSNASSQIIDSSGDAMGSSTNPINVVFGAASTQAVNIVDSSGVAYSGTNPLPTTASVTLSAAVGQGDSDSALRTIQAGDSVSSVVVNSGTITTVTTLTGITNSVAAVNLDRDGNPQAAWQVYPVSTGLNTSDANTLKVSIMTDNNVSTNITQFNGTAPATGLNENTAGVLKVAMITSVVESTNIVTFNGNAPATGLNETTSGVLRTAIMTDNVVSTVVNSGTITTVTTLTGVTNTVNVRLDTPDGIVSASNPFPVTFAAGGADSLFVAVAHTALPAAKSNGADVRVMADKYGRDVNRPIQVRDLIATAFVSLTTGTETTLLAASAGKQYDLIWILLSNESTAAVQVDLRAVTAGNKVMSFQVPANGTVGIAPPVPLNATSDTGNNWTVDMPDITGTTVDITALFTQEI